MTRIIALSVVLLLASIQSTLACTSLYSWFDRVFGPRTLLYMPLGFELPDVLDDLSGYVVLGTEVVDNFRGCTYERIVQFRSGEHVTCDDYGWDYASRGTEVVIVARPAASGKDTIGSCKAHCKMIVTDFFDNDVYDVSCADYAESVRGVGFGEMETPDQPPSAQPAPDTSGRVDLGSWNWLYDLPGGPDQETLDFLYQLADDCEEAERLGWPDTLGSPTPILCEDLGDLYP